MTANTFARHGGDGPPTAARMVVQPRRRRLQSRWAHRSRGRQPRAQSHVYRLARQSVRHLCRRVYRRPRDDIVLTKTIGAESIRWPLSRTGQRPLHRGRDVPDVRRIFDSDRATGVEASYSCSARCICRRTPSRASICRIKVIIASPSRRLPNLSQISPVREIIAVDVDGDGNLDLVVAGNLYDQEPIPRGRMPEADCGSRAMAGVGSYLSRSHSAASSPARRHGPRARENACRERRARSNNGDSLQAFLVKRR